MVDAPRTDPDIISGLNELREWLSDGETETIFSSCTPTVINAYLATFGYKRIFSYSDVQMLNSENDFLAIVTPHENGSRIRIIRVEGTNPEQMSVTGGYVYVLKGIKYDRTFPGEKTQPELIVGEPEFADGDEGTREFIIDGVLAEIETD